MTQFRGYLIEKRNIWKNSYSKKKEKINRKKGLSKP